MAERKLCWNKPVNPTFRFNKIIFSFVHDWTPVAIANCLFLLLGNVNLMQMPSP